MYTQVQSSGESLKNHVALLWVEVGQPRITLCYSRVGI